MDEIKRTDGLPFARRLGLPPRERCPRNWWKITVWLIAFFWLWSNFQFTYDIVEIDDGSAPSFGPYIESRFIDGRAAAVRVRAPLSGEKSPAAIVLEPVKSWKWSVEYYVVPQPQRGLDAQRIKLFAGHASFGQRCVVILRWKSGIANLDGCVPYAPQTG